MNSNLAVTTQKQSPKALRSRALSSLRTPTKIGSPNASYLGMLAICAAATLDTAAAEIVIADHTSQLSQSTTPAWYLNSSLLISSERFPGAPITPKLSPIGLYVTNSASHPVTLTSLVVNVTTMNGTTVEQMRSDTIFKNAAVTISYIPDTFEGYAAWKSMRPDNPLVQTALFETIPPQSSLSTNGASYTPSGVKITATQEELDSGISHIEPWTVQCNFDQTKQIVLPAQSAGFVCVAFSVESQPDLPMRRVYLHDAPTQADENFGFIRPIGNFATFPTPFELREGAVANRNAPSMKVIGYINEPAAPAITIENTEAGLRLQVRSSGISAETIREKLQLFHSAEADKSPQPISWEALSLSTVSSGVVEGTFTSEVSAITGQHAGFFSVRTIE